MCEALCYVKDLIILVSSLKLPQFTQTEDFQQDLPQSSKFNKGNMWWTAI